MSDTMEMGKREGTVLLVRLPSQYLFGDALHGVLQLRNVLERVQGYDPVIMVSRQEEHGWVLHVV